MNKGQPLNDQNLAILEHIVAQAYSTLVVLVFVHIDGQKIKFLSLSLEIVLSLS